MYGIYANIWGILMVNVTIYSIHGSYGIDQHGATDPRRKLAPYRSMSCTMRSHCRLRIWTFTCWYSEFWGVFSPCTKVVNKGWLPTRAHPQKPRNHRLTNLLCAQRLSLIRPPCPVGVLAPSATEFPRKAASGNFRWIWCGEGSALHVLPKLNDKNKIRSSHTRHD
jgi:hypothetical protein